MCLLNRIQNKNIEKIEHIQSGPWHQYDVLSCKVFGWEDMYMTADKVLDKDFININMITVADSIGGNTTDVTDKFIKEGNCLSTISDLKKEKGVLSIAGESKSLKAPIKIMWINQTRMMRFFTLCGNQNKIVEYIENILRR